MPTTAWPPAFIMTKIDPDTGEPRPDWPPPGYSVLEFDREVLDGLRKQTFDDFLANYGFQRVTPTAEEDAAFNAARCDEGHRVDGIVLVHSSGPTRYPFARCRNAGQHGGSRQLLVLWNAPSYTL